MAPTIETGLRGINAYPIHQTVLESACVRRGLQLDAELTSQVMQSKAYNLALADLYMWLADAPDVSQGGQSFTLDAEQRKAMRNKAASIYMEFHDGAATVYGYKGNRL